MYKHASIGAVINDVVFDGLLSYGMQYPEYFDDSLFTVDPAHEDMGPSHKPTLSLVTIALVVTAVSLFCSRSLTVTYTLGSFAPGLWNGLAAIMYPRYLLGRYTRRTSTPSSVSCVNGMNIPLIRQLYPAPLPCARRRLPS